MKRRRPPRVFISPGKHDIDHGFDLVAADDNRNVVVIDAKADFTQGRQYRRSSSS